MVPGDTGHGSFVRGGVEETPGFGGGTVFKGESSSYIIPEIPQVLRDGNACGAGTLVGPGPSCAPATCTEEERLRQKKRVVWG